MHAGLVIIVPQVAPPTQLQLFDAVLVELSDNQNFVNEVIEVMLADDGVATVDRYPLPIEGE